MMWIWVFVALALLYLAGRVWAYLRGAPHAEEIRHHWNHWLGRAAARFAPKEKRNKNWKVTLGRHTFVREDHIEAASSAHEFHHSLDAHRLSIPVFIVKALYQYSRYGYSDSPMEIKARAYAVAHATEFPDLVKTK